MIIHNLQPGNSRVAIHPDDDDDDSNNKLSSWEAVNCIAGQDIPHLL
jgi:hypothetical protein